MLQLFPMAFAHLSEVSLVNVDCVLCCLFSCACMHIALSYAHNVVYKISYVVRSRHINTCRRCAPYIYGVLLYTMSIAHSSNHAMKCWEKWHNITFCMESQSSSFAWLAKNIKQSAWNGINERFPLIQRVEKCVQNALLSSQWYRKNFTLNKNKLITRRQNTRQVCVCVCVVCNINTNRNNQTMFWVSSHNMN